MRIEKKIWPQFFDAIDSGKKTYELRLADWECKEGDELLLREWDPKTKKYTGRETVKKVKFIAKFKIDDLYWPIEEIKQYGLQILSIE